MRRWMSLLLILLLLGGCSDYNELEELMIVTGAAVDLTAEGGITLTAEVLRTEEAESGTGTPTVTYTVRAPSIAGCARELQRYLGGKVYWGHGELIVFSPAAIESCFSEALDWVLRDNEARLTVVFAVSGAESAADLFSAETGSFSAGKTLVHMLKNGTVPDAVREGAAVHLKNELEGGEPILLPLLGLADAADYRGEEDIARAVPMGAVLLLGGKDPTQVRAAARLNPRQAQLLMLSRGICGPEGCLLEGENWTVLLEKAKVRRTGETLALEGSCAIVRYAGGGRDHLSAAEAERCAAEAAALLEGELLDALTAAASALGPPPQVTVRLKPVSTGLISG